MITQDQARGDSPEVTAEDYAKHAQRGREVLDFLLLPQRCHNARDIAWRATREAWGGVTLDARTECPEKRTSGYAVAVNTPGTSKLHIPIDARLSVFNRAYDMARERYSYAPYLGIFRDDDTGTIDFDPVVIVETEDDARDIATYCESVGGAYDYSSGNGVFPYHVVSTSKTDVLMPVNEIRATEQEAKELWS